MRMPTHSRLQRSTPEAEGISSSAILRFVTESEKRLDALHSFMLLRHGRVVAEGWWAPYAPEHPHMLFSLSKSFTSTGVGLAVAEGRLTVDDPVVSYFPDDAPARVSKNLAAMRVRHLLSMSTGHTEDTLQRVFTRKDNNWAKAFLSQPVKREPGTHFVYNSGATYMLSAIVQKVAGMTLLDYLQPRLFEPLGILNPTWETCPRGINTGGWGLSVKTEDIARFGQLYLQKGKWRGRRLLPEAWVEQATKSQAPFSAGGGEDWKQGYGYQFWRCQHGAYRGDGAFGQYCIVMPDQDAVMAITSGVKDMQAVLNLAWERLLPAMKAAPLPADEIALDKLNRKLASLSLAPQPGKRASPLASKASGRKYAFETNDQKLEAVSLDFTPDGSVLTVRDGHGEHRITCGNGVWATGTTALDNGIARRVAASGAWTAEDTFTAKLCFYETPFCPTIACRFVGNRLRFVFTANVGFGPTERPQLEGRIAKI